ncbi:MAG: hypothetical protein K6F64_09190 [Clostridia bacterium]|nr:hypothetical protein [Clostridia bacterium]
MNSKIEKLLAEQKKNNDKIEDYRSKISSLHESIKELNARNKEIDAEISNLNDEVLLSLVKAAGYETPEEFKKLIQSLKQKQTMPKPFDSLPVENDND